MIPGGRKSLQFVEVALHGVIKPQRVSEIMTLIEESGTAIASITSSQTPHNTIARDIALDIKEKGDRSRFMRISKGRFLLRSHHR